MSRVRRTCEEVRRKFRDMQSLVKKKAASDTKYMEGTGKSIKCHLHVVQFVMFTEGIMLWTSVYKYTLLYCSFL